MLRIFPLKWTLYFMAYFICGVKIVESDSFEINHMKDEETSPLYNTVVFSDIADIMTELDPRYYEIIMNKDSESGENIEDLLSTYQNYLDNKIKRESNGKSRRMRNKISIIDQDFVNNSKDSKYNEYFYPTVRDIFNPKFKELDILVPYNAALNQKPSNGFGTTKQSVVKKDISKIQLLDETKAIINSKLRDLVPPIPSACICDKGEIPCDCGCKQCLFPFLQETTFDSKSFSRNQSPKIFTDFKTDNKFLTPAVPSLLFGKSDDHFFSTVNLERFFPQEQSKENTLNIHLKLEIQLPNKEKNIGNMQINNSQIHISEIVEKNNSKMLPIATGPVPLFSFPVELNELRITKKPKSKKPDFETFNSVNHHQKRKTKHTYKKHQKVSGTNKQIKTKNITITEKSLNHNSQIYKEVVTDTGTTFKTVISENNNTNHFLTETTTTSSIVPNFKKAFQEMLATSINDNMVISRNYAEHSVVDLNVTQINDTVKNSQNLVSTSKRKRSISAADMKKIILPAQATLKKTKTISIDKNKSFENKTKVPQNIPFLDDQLLYWPTGDSLTRTLREDITTIIVQKETQKSKFNLSRDAIRDNHTKALEQAVFGEVDWNDMNAVTPVFMSFIGKYLTGVLTFCSEENCHSMKCEHKLCVHRICSPVDRRNQVTHCLGSNHTDSAVSMDSIMDLPSNTVLELVDILQDRLQGKLFGKATLCTTTKCVTMAAAKKGFFKIKCSVKEINSIGHCPFTKKVYG